MVGELNVGTVQDEVNSEFLRAYMKQGEAVLWFARKSEKLLARDVMFKAIVGGLCGVFFAYRFVQLGWAIPYASTDSWLETANFASAILLLCFFIITIPVLIYQVILNLFRFVQIIQAPRALIYAITPNRILKFLIGHKEDIEEIAVKKCDVQLEKSFIRFVNAKPTWLEWFFVGDIVMLGLTKEERQEAIDTIKQVWTKP